MKKTLVSILVSVAVILSLTTIVKATTTEELINYAREQGGSYVTESDIVRIERYFKQYPITEEQANKLKEKIDSVKAIVDASSTKELKKFSKEDKEKIKSIINEVAAIIDVNVVFRGYYADIYKDGKLLETARIENNQILVYTGNNTNYVVVAISGVAIIALAAGVIIMRKKLNNAK